ncbi:C-type lectin domain family 2 member D-like isoform X2 [Meleagris gallopavo]|uniref:C-type lectin domain family 2 member D-like isoform X2 n=1 Tax=Meleagris gallopavo TaxID=9103 RepID=UPI000549DFCB|nr:C-type lectin domain family 2 member D-like isoform X2 [Meleagris gallopavo]
MNCRTVLNTRELGLQTRFCFALPEQDRQISAPPSNTMAAAEQQSDMPQREAMLHFSAEENQRSERGCKWNVGRRKTALLLFVSGVLVGVIAALVFGRVLQHCELCSPRTGFSHVCPNAWLGFQGKCFYFSDNESDWNSSREQCQRLGASLATVDTEEERVFMLRYLGPANCWIGLHRAEGDEHWTWANGSTFTNWFQLRGGGRCAYLNGDRISSALCHTEKLWVCSRADSFVLWKQKAFPD